MVQPLTTSADKNGPKYHKMVSRSFCIISLTSCELQMRQKMYQNIKSKLCTIAENKRREIVSS